MTQQEIDELLAEAHRLFPPGCTYRGYSGGSQHIHKGQYPYWYSRSSTDCGVALGESDGLVWKHGVWGTVVKMPEGYNIEPQYEIY